MVVEPLKSLIHEHKREGTAAVLRLIIKDRLKIVEQNSDLAWIVITEMRYHPDIMQIVHKHIFSNISALAKDFLAFGAEQGEFRIKSPEVLSQALLSTVTSVIAPKLLLGIEVSDQRIDSAIDVLLNGILSNEVA